jgi:hypothetical protein
MLRALHVKVPQSFQEYIMRAQIHVNQHVIRANKKDGRNHPPLTVKTYKSNEYARSVKINGPSTVVYAPEMPLSCGAHVWIEAEYEVLELET